MLSHASLSRIIGKAREARFCAQGDFDNIETGTCASKSVAAENCRAGFGAARLFPERGK